MHQETTPSLAPTARVFFAELMKSDLLLTEAGVPVLVTPTGARCQRLFGVGALEAIERRGKITRLRLTDSTASLFLYTHHRIPDERAETGDESTYIAFLGTVHAREAPGKGKHTVIMADEVAVVENWVRTEWMLTTAKRTMERIGELRAALRSAATAENAAVSDSRVMQTVVHYALDHEKLDALAGVAVNAVKRAWEDYRAAARTVVLEMLQSAGPRGMEHARIMSALQARGYPEKWGAAVIDELIMDGQCYENESGLLRS
jgi:RPA family protein